MTPRKERLTITVDPDLVKAGKRAVAAGQADSLSAWVAAALATRSSATDCWRTWRMRLLRTRRSSGSSPTKNWRPSVAPTAGTPSSCAAAKAGSRGRSGRRRPLDAAARQQRSHRVGAGRAPDLEALPNGLVGRSARRADPPVTPSAPPAVGCVRITGWAAKGMKDHRSPLPAILMLLSVVKQLRGRARRGSGVRVGGRVGVRARVR